MVHPLRVLGAVPLLHRLRFFRAPPPAASLCSTTAASAAGEEAPPAAAALAPAVEEAVGKSTHMACKNSRAQRRKWCSDVRQWQSMSSSARDNHFERT